MKKIKDSVDLKELENFGYKFDDTVFGGYIKRINNGNNTIAILINVNNPQYTKREIYINSTDWLHNLAFSIQSKVQEDFIKDLIDAELVEDIKPKIIFLDVDGVLNYYKFHLTNEKIVSVSEDCVENLKSLIQKTKAKVVLSSTWRFHKSRIDLLEKTIGIKFYDILPDDTVRDSEGNAIKDNNGYMQWLTRGQLIKNWLSLHDHSKYIILDDDSDGMEGMNLLQSNYMRGGFTSELLELAISMLEE